MEKLRVGVIGLGMGRAHSKGVMENDNAVLVAVADPLKSKFDDMLKDIADSDAEKDARFAKHKEKIGAVKFYEDWRVMIKECALDAVIIASPDQMHREMCIECLAAGLHVLCEKPLALTSEDCHAILDAAAKSDKKFMVGQICRFTPGFIGAKKIIDEGGIGDLVFVESEYAHDYKHIYEKPTWRNDPLRNGVVGGGCHAIDLLRWIAGDALEVTAYANRKIMPFLPYDDNTVAIIKFPKNVIGKVFVSVSCKRKYTMRSVFYGTKGTVITDNTSDHFLYHHEDAEGKLVEEVIPVDINNHNAAGEFAEFLRCIVENLPVPTPAIEGTKTVDTALAIVRSADLGGAKISLFDPAHPCM